MPTARSKLIFQPAKASVKKNPLAFFLDDFYSLDNDDPLRYNELDLDHLLED